MALCGNDRSAMQRLCLAKFCSVWFSAARDMFSFALLGGGRVMLGVAGRGGAMDAQGLGRFGDGFAMVCEEMQRQRSVVKGNVRAKYGNVVLGRAWAGLRNVR